MVVDIYNEILLGHKKEWNLTICESMDGPRRYSLSEISLTKTNTMWFHLHAESKEKTKETSKTETDSYAQRTDWWLPEGKGVGELGENGEGIEKNRLLVTKYSQGLKVQHRKYSQWYCNDYVCCQMHAWNIRGTLCKVCDCHCAVHLKLIQNNVECKV